MKFFEKKVKYFKFFEDSKIVEVDPINKRIAIIFFGKENIVHIFDASPYLDYVPIEEMQGMLGKSKEDNLNRKLAKQDIYEIFTQIAIDDKNPGEEFGKTIITQNQEYIKFNNFYLNNEEEINKKSKTTSKIESNISEKSSININLKAEYNKKEIKFSLLKPKIKNKILSVITCPSNIIIGIKWLDKPLPQCSNGQDKIQNKQLLCVFDDGMINIYSLKSSNYEIETKVNLSKLQYMPFETYPEQWKISGQVFSGRPIRDFYISDKCNRLYTLHTDNYIIMWMIAYIGNKLSLLSTFAINITPDLPVNKFLVDMNDRYIYTFHNEYFKIFKIMDKPPFPLLFSRKFDEVEIGNVQQVSKLVENVQDVTPLQKGNNGATTKTEKNRSNLNSHRSDNITPIKQVTDDFIDDDESYEIFYKDIIDMSEGMKIFDINFFYNVQKPEFSLLEEYILIPVYIFKLKQYVLLKFFNKEFLKKISDFSYFERSFSGNVDQEILKILKLSHSPIVFSLSPYFYFPKANIDQNNGEILDKAMNSLDVLNGVYQPILVINEGIVNFLNLKTNSEIINYELLNGKIINPEFLVINWTANNSILMSSTKALMNVIKFCNEENSLGIPVNPKRISELLSVM